MYTLYYLLNKTVDGLIYFLMYVPPIFPQICLHESSLPATMVAMVPGIMDWAVQYSIVPYECDQILKTGSAKEYSDISKFQKRSKSTLIY